MAAVSYSYRYAVLGELRRLHAARAAEEWLSTGERGIYAQFRPGPRGDNWLLGRLLAKELVMARLSARPQRERPLHPGASGFGRGWPLTDGSGPGHCRLRIRRRPCWSFWPTAGEPRWAPIWSSPNDTAADSLNSGLPRWSKTGCATAAVPT
jgi:hypothetical protein